MFFLTRSVFGIPILAAMGIGAVILVIYCLVTGADPKAVGQTVVGCAFICFILAVIGLFLGVV